MVKCLTLPGDKVFSPSSFLLSLFHVPFLMQDLKGSFPMLLPINLDQWEEQKNFIFLNKEPVELMTGLSLANSGISCKLFDQFYGSEPLYLKLEEGRTISRALAPPPVDRLTIINGIGIPTETNYFYTVKDAPDTAIPFLWDKSMEKKEETHSHLNISRGIGYEK